MTLAGLKGMSVSACEFITQSRIFSTSDDCTLNSSQFLTADSRSTLIEYGREAKTLVKSFESLTQARIIKSWQLVERVGAQRSANLFKWVGLGAAA